jgi:hypothetical protein
MKNTNDLCWSSTLAEKIQVGNYVTTPLAKTPRLISNIIKTTEKVSLFELSPNNGEILYWVGPLQYQFDLLTFCETRIPVTSEYFEFEHEKKQDDKIELLIIVQNIRTAEIIFATKEPMKAVFFEVCVREGKKSVKMAKILAEIGWEMYLKDEEPTPVGHLADFLATRIKNVKHFQQFTVGEQVASFYNWLH